MFSSESEDVRKNVKIQNDNEIKRKAVTISGIALSQDSSLPKSWVWRDDPGALDPKAPKDRLTRMDTKIESEPYVKALSLHLYKEDAQSA